jgi:hypothetical protein
MLGFDLLLGFIMLHFSLVDLLDLRYNKERKIALIPSFDITWTGSGRTLILSLIISWLNLEVSVIGYDFDYYCDKLEGIINDLIDDEEKEDKEE